MSIKSLGGRQRLAWHHNAVSNSYFWGEHTDGRTRQKVDRAAARRAPPKGLLVEAGRHKHDVGRPRPGKRMEGGPLMCSRKRSVLRKREKHETDSRRHTKRRGKAKTVERGGHEFNRGATTAGVGEFTTSAQGDKRSARATTSEIDNSRGYKPTRWNTERMRQQHMCTSWKRNKHNNAEDGGRHLRPAPT